MLGGMDNSATSPQAQIAEFEEIAHSGGQMIFTVATAEDGRRSYQLTWTHSRPVASAIYAIYALPQGIPVGMIQMGGIGTPWNDPPIPGCYPVLIASDSEGLFGQQCPACHVFVDRGGDRFLSDVSEFEAVEWRTRLAMPS